MQNLLKNNYDFPMLIKKKVNAHDLDTIPTEIVLLKFYQYCVLLRLIINQRRCFDKIRN